MPALSLVHPRFSGLQRQFLLLIIGIYLMTGAVALALFGWGIRGVTWQLGEEFAVQYALRQKDRILTPIQRELALSRHLADSPLLKCWARDEENTRAVGTFCRRTRWFPRLHRLGPCGTG